MIKCYFDQIKVGAMFFGFLKVNNVTIKLECMKIQEVFSQRGFDGEVVNAVLIKATDKLSRGTVLTCKFNEFCEVTGEDDLECSD